MFANGEEMGHIVKYCPKCCKYQAVCSCDKKFEPSNFEIQFKRSLVDYVVVILPIVLTIIFFVLGWIIPAIITFLAFCLFLYIVLIDQRVFDYNFNKEGFELNLGRIKLEGRWIDEPALFFFPNPVEPEKLILKSRTKNLSIEELKDFNHNSHTFTQSTIEKEVVGVGKIAEIAKIENHVLNQFVTNNCYYVLLNTTIMRNSTDQLVVLSPEPEVADDYIKRSLIKESNSSKIFSYRYWNILGKCNSGWDWEFNSFTNLLTILRLKTSKYGDDKTYKLKIDDLINWDLVRIKKEKLGSDKILIQIGDELIDMKLDNNAHGVFIEYLKENYYLKV